MALVLSTRTSLALYAVSPLRVVSRCSSQIFPTRYNAICWTPFPVSYPLALRGVWAIGDLLHRLPIIHCLLSLLSRGIPAVNRT